MVNKALNLTEHQCIHPRRCPSMKLYAYVASSKLDAGQASRITRWTY